ncbi:N-acetyltransferase [Lacihabitans sp. LS3-19]|uniref:GNAT family N-acetyltransferase n=1 Tax=Lacihabitans sp. LS3-19 TaxID=2487335 RepID=UPI0020CD4566|nr:GNAT family N-acetyltransferase [Lacihabitans sp. LS3-19]MCP9769578.1 N-acetyltransferase [Lacihabitans sp. LS3-19]
MTIIETDRLTLRKFNLNDAVFILELLNTPLWLKFIGDKGVKTIQEAENYLKNGSLKSYEEKGFGLYLVEEKTTKSPIGMCGFIKRDELENLDLGFAFLPEYIGKGYGYEAANACIKFGKDVLGFEKIAAIVNPENEASNSLLVKLGFVLEKQIAFGENATLVNLYGI